jgi:ankyrin repeat protein
MEAASENLDVIMHLIKKGADVNQVSIEGWSPLLKAT